MLDIDMFWHPDSDTREDEDINHVVIFGVPSEVSDLMNEVADIGIFSDEQWLS